MTLMILMLSQAVTFSRKHTYRCESVKRTQHISMHLSAAAYGRSHSSEQEQPVRSHHLPALFFLLVWSTKTHEDNQLQKLTQTQILTKTVHAPPTTKQAMNPFSRVPQPRVEASFTVCVDTHDNVSWDHRWNTAAWAPTLAFTSKTVLLSLRASSPLKTDFNLSIAEDRHDSTKSEQCTQ